MERMKRLLETLSVMEAEMEGKEALQDDAEEDGDIRLAEEYEREADFIYEQIFSTTEEIVAGIVHLTGGKINEPLARTMLRTKRADLERIFA